MKSIMKTTEAEGRNEASIRVRRRRSQNEIIRKGRRRRKMFSTTTTTSERENTKMLLLSSSVKIPVFNEEHEHCKQVSLTSNQNKKPKQEDRSKNKKANASMMLQLFLLIIKATLALSYATNTKQQQPISLPSVLSQTPQTTNPQQISSISGLQQSMAQLLQVFNGNDSQQLEANHFKLLERDGDFVLLGARNVVYNLSLSTMREQRRLEWPSSEEDVKLCRVKGKSLEQCQNYIRVLKLQAPETLFVCGTNAYKPRCRTYLITNNAYELVSEMPGEGACPYQENQNVTSLFADGELYSATAAQFSGIDGLIHRAPLRTEQFNPKQLNSPNFVSSFRYGEHVYFLFREIAIEHINCGKAIYSRIARVCINDSGGPSRANRERWTSFVKARLNCSIPGEFPFYFDEIQASTQIVTSFAGTGNGGPSGGGESSSSNQQANNDLFYAVFTTPTNSIGGSAVCAYRMSDVLAAFEGPFKSQQDTNSNWLPVPESRVPRPRPGTCVNDSKQLPDEKVNFIKDNPLMDMAVEAVWSQPLVMMASINFRFTQIVVDSQVESQMVPGASTMRTDVIFVSTDDGRVFKLINTHHLTSSMMLGSASLSLSASMRNKQPTQALQMASSSNMNGMMNFMPSQAESLLATSKANRPEPLPDVSSGTVVIEELHLFDARTPIVNMLIYYPPLSTVGSLPPSIEANQLVGQHPKLVVVAGKQLKAVPLSRCERALTCADCLALYDPYCAWDLRHQACLSVGRSTAVSSSSYNLHHMINNNHQYASSGRASAWYPPNNSANNHTLGWWNQCPLSLTGPDHPQVVGAPYRSLFSSHLQVPSRFDYASGHHLSHTAMVSLLSQNQPSSASISAINNHYRQPQPVSECLTFCGGLYTPLQQAPITTSGAAAAVSDPNGQQQLMMNCADIVQQHYIGNLQSGNGQMPGGSNQAHLGGAGNLYTSENLYLAVIICAVSGLILGLVFGFAIGRNTKKHDSSICSSTFDETNLYMASTGSHHGPNLFGGQQHQQLHHHQRLLHQQPNGTNELLGGALGSNGGLVGTNLAQQHHLFETNQCLMRSGGDSTPSTYGNQQQMLLHLTNQGQISCSGNNGPTMRTGQLPPLPTMQQTHPLVNTSTSTTHLNHSQLTPNSANGSSTSASSTNTSSTSATVPVTNDQHHQLYLNKQQLVAAQQQQQQQHSLHQRTFTNSSTNSNSTNNNMGNIVGNSNKLNSAVGNKLTSATTNGKSGQTYLQQQSQLQPIPQQNNKIYL